MGKPVSRPCYSSCPLCGSADIRLGTETLTVARPDGEAVKVPVRRWACPACGERFLTDESREKLDAALALPRGH